MSKIHLDFFYLVYPVTQNTVTVVSDQVLAGARNYWSTAIVSTVSVLNAVSYGLCHPYNEGTMEYPTVHRFVLHNTHNGRRNTEDWPVRRAEGLAQNLRRAQQQVEFHIWDKSPGWSLSAMILYIPCTWAFQVCIHFPNHNMCLRCSLLISLALSYIFP